MMGMYIKPKIWLVMRQEICLSTSEAKVSFRVSEKSWFPSRIKVLEH